MKRNENIYTHMHIIYTNIHSYNIFQIIVYYYKKLISILDNNINGDKYIFSFIHNLISDKILFFKSCIKYHILIASISFVIFVHRVISVTNITCLGDGVTC